MVPQVNLPCIAIFVKGKSFISLVDTGCTRSLVRSGIADPSVTDFYLTA